MALLCECQRVVGLEHEQFNGIPLTAASAVPEAPQVKALGALINYYT